MGAPRNYSGHALYLQWVCPVFTVGVPCNFTYPRVNIMPTLEQTTTYPRPSHQGNFPVSSQAGTWSIVPRESCSTTGDRGGTSGDLHVLENGFALVQRWLQWMCPVITVGVPCTYSGRPLYLQWVCPVVQPTLEHLTRETSQCPARPASGPSCSGRVILPLGAVVTPAGTCPL